MDAGRRHDFWVRHRGLDLLTAPGSMSFRFTSAVLPAPSKFDRGNKEVVLLGGAHTAGSHSRWGTLKLVNPQCHMGLLAGLPHFCQEEDISITLDHKQIFPLCWRETETLSVLPEYLLHKYPRKNQSLPIQVFTIAFFKALKPQNFKPLLKQ